MNLETIHNIPENGNFDFIDLLESTTILRIEPMELVQAFHECHIITEKCFEKCLKMSEQNCERKAIFLTLFSELSRPYSLKYLHVVIGILNEKGYVFLAKRTERCIKGTGASFQVVTLYKKPKKTHRYFYIHLRQAFRQGLVENPIDKIATLSTKLKQDLIDVQGRNRDYMYERELAMKKADKYAASLILQFEFSDVDIEKMNHCTSHRDTGMPENVLELERIAPLTTSPLWTQFMLYSRLAMAFLYAGNIQMSENMLIQARMFSFMIGKSPEQVEIYHHYVSFLLKKFEQNPKAETQNEIEQYVRSALGVIRELDEEMGSIAIDWEHALLVKLVSCLVGIGNHCNIINDIMVTEECITKAREGLARIDDIWEHVNGARNRMLYYLLKGRIEEICGNLKMARHYINISIRYCVKGCFVEINKIEMYLHNLATVNCTAYPYSQFNFETEKETVNEAHTPISGQENTELSSMSDQETVTATEKLVDDDQCCDTELVDLTLDEQITMSHFKVQDQTLTQRGNGKSSETSKLSDGGANTFNLNATETYRGQFAEINRLVIELQELFATFSRPSSSLKSDELFGDGQRPGSDVEKIDQLTDKDSSKGSVKTDKLFGDGTQRQYQRRNCKLVRLRNQLKLFNDTNSNHLSSFKSDEIHANGPRAMSYVGPNDQSNKSSVKSEQLFGDGKQSHEPKATALFRDKDGEIVQLLNRLSMIWKFSRHSSSLKSDELFGDGQRAESDIEKNDQLTDKDSSKGSAKTDEAFGDGTQRQYQGRNCELVQLQNQLRLFNGTIFNHLSSFKSDDIYGNGPRAISYVGSNDQLSATGANESSVKSEQRFGDGEQSHDSKASALFRDKDGEIVQLMNELYRFSMFCLISKASSSIRSDDLFGDGQHQGRSVERKGQSNDMNSTENSVKTSQNSACDSDAEISERYFGLDGEIIRLMAELERIKLTNSILNSCSSSQNYETSNDWRARMGFKDPIDVLILQAERGEPDGMSNPD